MPTPKGWIAGIDCLEILKFPNLVKAQFKQKTPRLQPKLDFAAKIAPIEQKKPAPKVRLNKKRA